MKKSKDIGLRLFLTVMHNKIKKKVKKEIRPIKMNKK